MYEQALQQRRHQRAAPRRPSQPNQVGAPAFPDVLSAPAPAPSRTPRGPSIPTSGSRARWQNNVQFEHALNDRYSCRHRRLLREGLRPAGGDQHQPDQPDPAAVRRHPGVRHRDQRGTRVDPRYNVINMVESLGESTPKGDVAFVVDSTASVTANGKKVMASDLPSHVGNKVTVHYTEAGGQKMAQSVRVTMAAPKTASASTKKTSTGKKS